jgi:hypothetical protein
MFSLSYSKNVQDLPFTERINIEIIEIGIPVIYNYNFVIQNYKINNNNLENY